MGRTIDPPPRSRSSSPASREAGLFSSESATPAEARGSDAPREGGSPYRTRLRAALAIATGLLVWVSFPAIGFWPLAFVAWMPLLYAIERAPESEAFALGWLSGAIMTGLGTAFVLPVMNGAGGFGALSSILLFTLLVAWEGCRAGLTCWLARRASARGWPFSMAFLLAFAGAEIALPMPFEWTFGASVHAVLPLAQVADLGGAVAVSVVVVATNVALHGYVFGRRNEIAWLALPVAAVVYGIARMRQIDEDDRGATRIRVELAHTTDRPGARRAPRLWTASAPADSPRSAIVVTSEAAVPGVFREEDLEGSVSAALGERVGPAWLVAGVIIEQKTPTSRAYFNSAVIVDPSGRLAGRYDKHAPLLFGERMPFARALPVLGEISPRSGEFTPGVGAPRLAIEGHPVTITICNEDTLGPLVNRLAREQAPELLVNMTNDGWFAGSSEPIMHLELARLRAIEHRRYLVRATNFGVTAAIDPNGRVASSPRADENASFSADVAWCARTTLYESFGDGPWWGSLGAIVALGFLRKPKRSSERADDARSRAATS